MLIRTVSEYGTHANIADAADDAADPDISGGEADVAAAVNAMADAAALAQQRFAQCTSEQKDDLLNAIADALEAHADDITVANAEDLQAARRDGMSPGLIDRLRFDATRIAAAAASMRAVAAQPDPVGELVRGHRMPNGMRLTQVRVPMGVVAMIYEARPNVTIDVTALALKSGNAVVLRGGHAAERTNAASLSVIHDSLKGHGYDAALVACVDRYGRAGADALMRARGHVDLLVPRGGAGLIRAVVEHATVPVIETGAGNVHIYVDASADLAKAVDIIVNSKTQRVGVCNAAEKLLIHRQSAAAFLPVIVRALADRHVQIRADDAAYQVIQEAVREAGATSMPGLDLRRADEQDWDTEYLAPIMGVKVVDSLDEAVAHINRHSTHHTEAIVSEDYAAIEDFTRRVDSAVVMVNASTRFTDGGEFGLGAELGISTQKLHARGPMGLRELTTTKWIAYGNGQVRH